MYMTAPVSVMLEIDRVAEWEGRRPLAIMTILTITFRK